MLHLHLEAAFPGVPAAEIPYNSTLVSGLFMYRYIYIYIYYLYIYIYIINSFRLRYMYVSIYIYIPPYLNIYRKLLPMHMYTPTVDIHVYHNICAVYPRAFHNIEFWQPVLLFEKLSKMLGNEQTARPGVWMSLVQAYLESLNKALEDSRFIELLHGKIWKICKHKSTVQRTCSVFSELASLTLSVFVGSFGTYMPYHSIARSPSIPSPNGTDTT